jgi:NADH-quinone oxidoreductase subunit J
VFPFEVTSALLITAALGAMVLAHRERTSPRPTQRVLSRRRVASGRPTPLPGPGTYARHNAVDMPALLPDGTQSRLSVSGVLTTQETAGGLPLARGDDRRQASGGVQRNGTRAISGETVEPDGPFEPDGPSGEDTAEASSHEEDR